MRKPILFILFILLIALTGCIKTRTYTAVQERPDQSLEGNRGYIYGTIPPEVSQEKERKVYRKKKVIEIEFFKPSELKKQAEEEPAYVPSVDEYGEEYAMPTEESSLLGGIPEVELEDVKEESSVYYDTYVVQKGDTLEKISKEVYGDWKKWKKIYEANKDKLKSPDRIYLGQKLKIPRQ